MATYIQGLYNQPLQIAPFAPDYGFLNTVLKTKEAQYEQGFAQVKSMYNSLQKELTNDGNKDAQKKYTEDAELKLKNLAAVDLSVDKNVGLASEVFKPFFEDKQILHDAYVTSVAKTQLGIGQGFLSSDDPKKRALHSAISDRYVGISLDELKRAKRDDGSILKVKSRNYIPAPNLTEKFKEFLDPTKYKSVIQTPGGQGFLIETAGGEIVEKGLDNIINGMLTGDERLWFNAWGEVAHNDAVNEYVDQGYKEDEARRKVATDFYQKDVQFYETKRDANKKNMDLIEEQMKLLREKDKSKNGLLPKDVEKYQKLKSAFKEYQTSYNEYSSQVTDLTSADKKQAAIDRYYTGKGGILGQMFLENSVQSIVKGMGILTKQVKFVKDEAYFANLEHTKDMLDLQIKQQKLQMGMEDDEDGTGTRTGNKASSGSKLSEEEKKRIGADTPSSGGLSPVPKVREDKLQRFYQLKDNLYTTMVSNGLNAVEKMMSDEFTQSGGPSLSKLTELLLKKKNSGKFYDEAIELNGVNSGPGTTSNEQTAVLRFNELFNTNGNNVESEFQTFLKANRSKQGVTSYADVYNFLLNKAQEKFTKSKETLPDEEYIMQAGEYFQNIEQAKVVEATFNDAEAKIQSKTIDRISSIIDTVKYSGNLLTYTDEKGYKRLKSKDVLEKDVKELDTPIGYEIQSFGGRGRSKTVYFQPGSSKQIPLSNDTIQYFPLYSVSEEERRKARNSVRDYDKIEKQINLTAADELKVLDKTGDGDQLYTYGTYLLQDIGSIKGEQAENAIINLFSPMNTSISNEDPLKNNVDVQELLKKTNFKPEDARVVLSELSTTLRNTGNQWNNAVEYRPSSTLRGDARKEYVVKLDAGKLNEMIETYSKDKRENLSKIAILQNIKDYGITFRTQDNIPGDISSYGLVERFYQSQNFYESPKSMDHVYHFRIEKSSDGSRYELRNNSYYSYTDPYSGERKQIPLPKLDFPGTASFTTSSQIVKNFILGKIKEVAALRKTNEQKTQNKIRIADIDKESD